VAISDGFKVTDGAALAAAGLGVGDTGVGVGDPPSTAATPGWIPTRVPRAAN
jgi:hypothetical protein